MDGYIEPFDVCERAARFNGDLNRFCIPFSRVVDLIWSGAYLMNAAMSDCLNMADKYLTLAKIVEQLETPNL